MLFRRKDHLAGNHGFRRLQVEALEAREVPSATPLVLHHDTLVVQQGNANAKYQTIQSAVNAALPGDTIRIDAGTYKEAVTVTTPDLTITAAPGAKVVIQPPTTGSPLNGITVRGVPGTPLTGFTLDNVQVNGFADDGVSLVNVTNFHINGVTAENNGLIGISVILSSNGSIQTSKVVGNNDSGVSVNQSTSVVVHGITAYNNTNGIEIENSSSVQTYGNTVFYNTVGILADTLPAGVVAIPSYNPVTTSSHDTIGSNQVFANNRPNTAPTSDLASIEQPGTGILIIGGNSTLVQYNNVYGNAYSGIALMSGSDLLKLAPHGTPTYGQGIDPNPDNTTIQYNTVQMNGWVVAPNAFPAAADLVWTGTGTNDVWKGNTFSTSTPATLPS